MKKQIAVRPGNKVENLSSYNDSLLVLKEASSVLLSLASSTFIDFPDTLLHYEANMVNDYVSIFIERLESVLIP